MNSAESSRPLGIKFYSYHEQSGYAEAGRRYLRAIRDTGIPVTWTPLVPGKNGDLWHSIFLGDRVGDAEFDVLCNKSLPYDTVIAHTIPEHFPSIRAREDDHRLVGCTVWETSTIPDSWLPLLNSADVLLVPSSFNQQTFQKDGVIPPVHLFPHIYKAPSNLSAADAYPAGPQAFCFYTIDKWSHRKGTELTVRAYLQEFTAVDDVVLIIKTTPLASDRDSSLVRRLITGNRSQSSRGVLDGIIKEFSSPARIVLLDQVTSDDDIASLHRQGQCYISLSRGEGWGIGAFDAGSYGNPVIMTGFGGQLDYLPADIAYLIDYKLAAVEDKGSSYTSNQVWAEPNVEHASKLMRSVYENRQQAKARGGTLRENIVRKFSPDVVMHQLQEKLFR